MLHENVDKDPDLRKSSDIEEANPSWVPRLITVVAVLAVITGIVLVRIYYSPNWGPGQWGDAATWVAGIATSLAVIVAVWQTNNANKQARAAEKRAKEDARVMAERHRKEMEAADKRLAHELDATRRIEQIRTIPPIWDAISELAMPYVDFKEVMPKAHQIAPIKEAAEAFKEQVMPWINGLRDVEMTFTPAVMTVSEPHTQKAITDLYEKVRKLHDLTSTELEVTMKRKRAYDGEEISALFKEISQSRKTMTNTVREHLMQVPPLTFTNGQTEADATAPPLPTTEGQA
ncbi:hypothetical protein M2284_005293 [Rhodococcus sp. LBL1]|nr:hypothetical protein [Rhodococcus sp. LBL1]MDH6686356.1 hypothetical protein [Rhodococcus sp. LBL2]